MPIEDDPIPKPQVHGVQLSEAKDKNWVQKRLAGKYVVDSWNLDPPPSFVAKDSD